MSQHYQCCYRYYRHLHTAIQLKRTVDLVPTADLRTALDAIGVKVLGAKKESARITAVTETGAAQGVFFRLADGTEHKVTRRLPVNQPSRIIARVPAAVPSDKVTVVIKTKYTG